MYKVLIADDESFVCQVLKKIIDWDGLGLSFLGEANDGLSALKMLEEHRPEIVITDIRMPGIDGLEFVHRAKEICPASAFIIISGHKHFDYARSAIKYGVEDYLLKPVNKKEINRVLGQICDRFNESRIEQEQHSLNQGKLEYSIDRLRTIFVESLLKDRIVINSIDELNTECQCEFREGFLQAVAIRIDSIGGANRSLAAEEISFVVGKVADEVSYQLQDKSIYTQKFYLNKVMYVVANLSSADHLDDLYKTIFDSIQQLMDRYNHYSCTLGIGKLLETSRFADVIKTAGVAVFERVHVGTDRIIYYNGEKVGTLSDSRTTASLNSLGNIVELCDEQAMDEWLSGVLEHLEQDTETAYEMFFESEYLLSTVFRTIAELMDKDFYLTVDERSKTARQVYDFLSWADLRNFLLVTIRECFDKYIAFKKMQIAQPVREAKKYISAHFSEDLTLEEVAGKVFLNPVYFSVMFKNEEGINFSKYLIDLRISKAKELLSGSQHSIGQIAGMVGYADHKHFSKLFKKTVGITPNEYRKLNH
ncbi:MAG: response regulator transcription factor [Christensenellaceae bacterium]|jgi:two-component system response regulator YesN